MAVDAADVRALVSRMSEVRMLRRMASEACLVCDFDGNPCRILDLGCIPVTVRVCLSIAVACVAGKLAGSVGGSRAVGTCSECLHQISVAFRAGIRRGWGLCQQESWNAKDRCIRAIPYEAGERILRTGNRAHTNCVVVQVHRCLKVAQIVPSLA